MSRIVREGTMDYHQPIVWFQSMEALDAAWGAAEARRKKRNDNRATVTLMALDSELSERARMWGMDDGQPV